MPGRSPSPSATGRLSGAAASCGCGAHETGPKAVSVDPEIKTSNLARLRRIEGQVRGLQRMVEADRYCADILIQISSVQEALRGVGRELLRNHLRHCVTDTLKKAEPRSVEAMFDELVGLFDRQRG